MKATPYNFVDLTGMTFGRLQVIEIAERGSRRRGVLWRCACVCGNEALVKGDKLRHGRTRSCGCLKRDLSASRRPPSPRTHGMRGNSQGAASQSEEKAMKKLVLGLIVGALAATTIPALASWVARGSGEAAGHLGSLSALKVEAAKGDGAALPGQDLPLVSTITNPNEIALTLTDIDLVDLDTDKDGCSLKGLKLAKKDMELKPGDNVVTVGVIHLPSSLATACQGATVTAKIIVTAAYGAS